MMTHKNFKSFREFYPYYLQQHSDKRCRLMHVVGSLLVLVIILGVLLGGHLLWLLAVPLVGYGFAWGGHFFFENNQPATFTYPFYSLMGDWVMLKDILLGRLK